MPNDLLSATTDKSLSINFLTDRGIRGVLEMTMQMTIGFENFKLKFSSVTK